MLQEILYYMFVYPMQSLLGFVLEWLYGLSANYGLSIVLLSILVNLFIYKLVALSESKAKYFEVIKKACDAKLAEFRRAFKGAELHAYTKVLYKQKHYHPIFALFSLGGLALQVPFFLGVWFLLSDFEAIRGVSFLWINDLSKPDSVFGVHILPILMTAITLINVFLSSNDRAARIQGAIIALIFLVLLYQMPSALVLYWSTNMLFGLGKTWWRSFCAKRSYENKECKLKSNISKIKIYCEDKFSNKPGGKYINKFFTPYSRLSAKEYSLYKNIIVFGVLNIALLICVYAPFAVYSTDVSQFTLDDMPAILSGLFGYFLIFSFIGIYVASFLYHTRFLKLISLAVSFLLLMGLVFNFVLPGDYGLMNHFVFDNIDFSKPDLKIYKYVSNITALILCAIVVFLLLKKILVIWKVCFYVQIIVVVINCFVIINNTIATFGEHNFNTTVIDSQQLDHEKMNNSEFVKKLLSYSKTEKNIVIFLLDAFSGSHIHAIFEQFPFLKDGLNGFVLFDNAISTANSTVSSIASVIGGEYYTTYNMNVRIDNHAESITRAFGEMGENFASRNYSVSYFSGIYGQGTKSVKKYIKNEGFITTNDDYFAGYYYNNFVNNDIKKTNPKYKHINKFLGFGLFRFVPELYFRPRIYKGGLWLYDVAKSDYFESVRYLSSFYGFTHFGNIDSKKPTLKWLHSLATHVPYGVYFANNRCYLFNNKTAWDDYRHTQEMIYPTEYLKNDYRQHFDAEACSLSYLLDYIKWLKDNGIFDNTQIFVVSDHGGNDSIGLDIDLSRADALFLFKDFNAKDVPLQIDHRLVANYDIASIFCENLPNGCQNVGKNILKNYPQNRELIHTRPAIKQYKPNQWIIDKYYIVKDNIYESKNWRNVTKEFDPKNPKSLLESNITTPNHKE